ncbi:MAG: aldehyde dehydrogenase family protein [Phenylobacterium sp.]|uniref:aldehyde dehydrogenase family protein n=1 Tax=Phenylobacterium sp. TaxID=1871053 RepID=UPI0027335E2A|nr:aldehyde dehydrogenase family protein [Phenylobacterium sp.]MDP3750002.1 aldehyde dehydrogenase family protein [Phenylobacterium sp.]
MRELDRLYLDGAWVVPSGSLSVNVINPATEEASGRLTLGDEADVDRAVAAAKAALPGFRQTSREERIALLERIIDGLVAREDDIAAAVTDEMGSPQGFSLEVQARSAALHARVTLETLRNYAFETWSGRTLVCHEPIGVCALITPWNYPAGAILTKLAPALATGCTVILKPSEYAPYSAQIVAEVIHGASLPPGVFNMVFGDGETVGAALSGHPDVDMVTITGSVRAGIEVARRAASTVKRVHQELGGKSPNILLDSADFPTAVPNAVRAAMINSGQACIAPTRLLVPASRREEVRKLAAEAAAAMTVGHPESGAILGPVANGAQWNHIQAMIKKGVDEGATLVCGGPGRPEGLDRGYYVRPTIFADTTPQMSVVRDEIFGPVLAIQEFDGVEHAIEMANDTPYGLGAYVHGADLEELRAIGGRLLAGQVFLNGTGMQIGDPTAPFGGVKLSGNGRERGAAAFEAFTEVKAYLGYSPPQTVDA